MNALRAIRRAIVALVLWCGGRLRPRPARRPPVRHGSEDPSRREVGAAPWAERLTARVLVLAGLAALGFVVLYVLDPNTQLLGVGLGTALVLLAAALAVGGTQVVPRETRVEERDDPSAPEKVAELAGELRESGQGIDRRRMLKRSAGFAGAGLLAAVAIPIAGLGASLPGRLDRTPWRRGRRLVDDEGKPIAAADVATGGFVTAFPEGADKDLLVSPVVLVRVDPSTLQLPHGRAGWAPSGILAYSKICTHAACAISLFRSPLSPTTQSGPPALVCPCHYSTFDVLDGGSVEFGPAGRPLPQLPLQIDGEGMLRAAGPMSGPVGPSFWGDAQ